MGRMESSALIRQVDPASLVVVRYPDPRLREVCAPVDEVDGPVRLLVERMFELMFASRGVGLAAPQVGIAVRLFIASPTFEESDRRVYIDPKIISGDGVQEGDEGCLSFPDISCKIKRHALVTIRARDLGGEWFEETGEELTARIFEHESDHLLGRLLVDRMGSVARLANRQALKELEETFAASGG